jgi:hypothetical protein
MLCDATGRFFDDFHGPCIIPATASQLGSSPWCKADTSNAGAPTLQGAGAGEHAVKGLLAADVEVENLCLYWGDVLSLPAARLKSFAFRAKITTALDDASDIVVMGLGSARADDPDAVASNLWFRVEANMNLLVEGDDTATDDDDNDTGIDMVTAVYKEFVIDFANGLSDIRFHASDANGKLTRVLPKTTFAFPTLATANLQPIFQISKAANADTHSFSVDCVEIEFKRG